MSTESAPPANARAVYGGLIALGVVSALIGAILMGVITYNYVTRPELRDPEPGLYEGWHATLPGWLTV